VSTRILVTGFLPFSDHATNISQQMVDLISSSDEFDFSIDSTILSVDEKGSREIANRIRSGEKYGAVLHMGFSENADEILIERFARNRLKMKIADNSGRIVNSGMICEGDGIMETNVSKSCLDLHVGGITGFRWNNDAGGFVCNETYYHSLLAAKESNTPKILFIHLPSEDAMSIQHQFEIIRRVCDALNQL